MSRHWALYHLLWSIVFLVPLFILIRQDERLTNGSLLRASSSSSLNEQQQQSKDDVCEKLDEDTKPDADVHHIDFSHALFLHVGKAAGGSIRDRLEKDWKLYIPYVHPKPSHHSVEKHQGQPMVINVRDPIDRYFSAFAWAINGTCNPDGDTRVEGKISLRPDLYCHERPEEAEILFHTWHKNATLLAESLYGSQMADQAQSDLRHIRHAGHPLSEWLDFDWTSAPQLLYPIVLEKPLDVIAQTDDFVNWLYAQDQFESEPLYANRQRRVQWRDCEQQQQQLAADEQSHVASQHASGASHHDSDIPEVVLKNLARFYQKDYVVLAQLKEQACKSPDCVRGIQSILDRRADLLASIQE